MGCLSILNRGLLVTIGLFTLAWDSWAEPIRVSMWTFKAASGAPATILRTNDSQIELAARALKQLDPEVILLQGVHDWRMCQQLARALKPGEYNIIGCSSFSDSRTNAPNASQVAILSRHKGYFFWSEPWRTADQEPMPGGFAVAAIQIGKRRLGVFSIQPLWQQTPAGGSAINSGLPAASVQQWVHALEILRSWETNRIEAAVVAAAMDPAPNGRDSKGQPKTPNAFAKFLAMPLGRAIIQPGLDNRSGAWTNYFSAHFIPGLEGLPGVVFGGSLATCDLDFDGVMPPVVASEPPTEATAQASTFVPSPANRIWQVTGLLGVLIAVVAVVWVFATRRSGRGLASRAWITEQAEAGEPASASFTVVVAPRSITGSALDDAGGALEPRPVVSLDVPKRTRTQSEVLPPRVLKADFHPERRDAVSAGLLVYLSQLMKEKLVRKLIADRAELMASQEASTLKVMKVDERLARIEAQLREQNEGYTQRIEKLTEELSAAKEENRELIRGQIMQVKAEMEAARARLVAEAKEPEE